MKQLHINDLLAVYEQYKAGTLETKTDKALLMLSLLRLNKAEKKVFTFTYDIPSNAFRGLNLINNRYWVDIKTRIDSIFGNFTIKIDESTTKKSLNMFIPYFIDKLFVANGIVKKQRNKPKLIQLTNINTFTLLTLEKSLKPNTLSTPDIVKLLEPHEHALQSIDLPLSSKLCNIIYIAMKKNKSTLLYMFKNFWFLYKTVNITLFQENCYIGNNNVKSLTDNLYRYCTTDKYLISIHLPKTLTAFPLESMKALYYLNKFDPLYKAIIAEKALFIDQLPSIKKTKEIIEQLGV